MLKCCGDNAASIVVLWVSFLAQLAIYTKQIYWLFTVLICDLESQNTLDALNKWIDMPKSVMPNTFIMLYKYKSKYINMVFW